MAVRRPRGALSAMFIIVLLMLGLTIEVMGASNEPGNDDHKQQAVSVNEDQVALNVLARRGSRSLAGCQFNLKKIAQRSFGRWNTKYYTLRDPSAPASKVGNGPRQWKVINTLPKKFRNIGECGEAGYRWLAWYVPAMPKTGERHVGVCVSKPGTTDVWHPSIAIYDCNGNRIKCGEAFINWKGRSKRQGYLIVLYSGNVIPGRYWLDYGGGKVSRDYHCDYWDYDQMYYRSSDDEAAADSPANTTSE